MEEGDEFMTEQDFDDFEKSFRKQHKTLNRDGQHFEILVEYAKPFTYEAAEDMEILIKIGRKTQDIRGIRYHVYSLRVLRWKGRRNASYAIF